MEPIEGRPGIGPL